MIQIFAPLLKFDLICKENLKIDRIRVSLINRKRKAIGQKLCMSSQSRYKCGQVNLSYGMNS